MNWESIIVGLIAAFPGVLVGLAALRAGREAHVIAKNTEHSVNSKMDLLLILKDQIAATATATAAAAAAAQIAAAYLKGMHKSEAE